ncbi:hypothetical protein [Parachryseolinea silvisoli]|uniref:hypothetical protein n=1 Tax=Parachryseolinea silvisoli TaxID=2873601 RepID=UPI002265D32E|nr:hypothetical protein [Parachryseolinea silvisoli]MCD9016569.1 hypothetical protein [Parachryseolinea silvisoli]
MEVGKKSMLMKTKPLLNVLRACHVFVKRTFPVIILSAIFLSCSDLNMTDVESQKLNNDRAASNNAVDVYTPLVSNDTLNFRRLDLYLEKGPAATGFILVVVRSVPYHYRVDSVAVPVSSLSAGSSWNSFVLSGRKIRKGEKYKIYVTRSSPHNIATGDYIAWRCSPNNRVDAYPPGLSDVNPDRISDYAFRTYADDAIDQEQSSASSRFFVGNKQPRWQEFVADYPRVNLTSVQLYLGVGPAIALADSLEVQVRGLRDSNALDSVIYRTVVPTASLLVGRHWNTIPIQGPLRRGQRFDIVLRRRGVHNAPWGNYIYWYRSTGVQDLYPLGSAGPFVNRNVDFTFKTFSKGGVDQQQTTAYDSTAVNNSSVLWQTFTPMNQ